jgi:hypothetical protein
METVYSCIVLKLLVICFDTVTFCRFVGDPPRDDVWPFNEQQRRTWLMAADSGISLTPSFLSELSATKSICEKQHDFIIRRSTREECLLAFIEIMIRRSRADYRNMIGCLDKTRQTDVIDWFVRAKDKG